MTPDKRDRIEQALNGVAKKVLDAVPALEAWPLNNIIAEMRRQGSANPDYTVVQGSIAKLRALGLIREPEAGRYQLVTVKQRSAPVVSIAEASSARQAEPAPAAKTASPLDRLASLAEHLRALQATVGAMAQAVEEAALEVQTELDAAAAGGQKLRQLQELLRSIQ